MCRHNEAMPFRRPVSNCWTTQALCLCIGVDTGHDMLITSGVDLSSAGIKVGEQVTVDLRKSLRKALTFAREDVILSEQFGPVRQGAKVAMTSGTAEVVKVSENDHELSLRGPFGGVHNLDVHGDINGEPVKKSERWQLCGFSCDTAYCHCDR